MRMLIRSIVTVLILITASLHAAEFDQAALSDGLKTALQRFVEDHTVAGAVAVVGSKSGVAQISSVGVQTVELNRPMPVDAVFRIASMTKPITALAIMQLQEIGRLDVNDPVEKHLPEFRGQMLAKKAA